VETIAAARSADPETQWVMHRTGKRECVWQEPLDFGQCRQSGQPGTPGLPF